MYNPEYLKNHEKRASYGYAFQFRDSSYTEADAMELQELYGLSRIQVEQLTKAEEGCGLLKCGNSIFSYNGQIEKGGYIYSLVDTKPDYGSDNKNRNKAYVSDMSEPPTELLTKDMMY